MAHFVLNFFFLIIFKLKHNIWIKKRGGSILGIESGDITVKNPDIVKIVDNIEKN